MDAETLGDPGHQATLRAKQFHPGKVHAVMLSTTERTTLSDLLRTAYRVLSYPLRMPIGDEIRSARKEKRLSQRELAKRMKVSASAVAQWELDETRPTVKNRADLSKMLSIPFIKLVPEIAVTGGISMSDQEILTLLEQLIALPAPVRQALLMGAAATAEHLRGLDQQK